MRAPLALGAALSVALTLSVFPLRSASAFCRSTTRRTSVQGECSRNGQPLQWRTNCLGFSLFVDGSPTLPMEVLRPESEEAALKWNRVGCDGNGTTQPHILLTRIDDTSTPSGYDPRGANANSVSFNEVWRRDSMHRTGTIAITVVTFDSGTGEILDADIELNQVSEGNPDGFAFTVGQPDPSAADMPTILTHEFGHFLGLSHSVDDSAVMWPEAGLGEQRRQPLVDDVRGICTIYRPEEAPDRLCNPVPYGGFARDRAGGRVIGSTCAVAQPGAVRGARPAARVASAVAALVALAAGARVARRRQRR